jgi:hypothetical protein
VKDATVVVPFPFERRRVEATNVQTSSRGMGTDARRGGDGGRAVRYFRDIHGSESIGFADTVRVHGDERRASGDDDVLRRYRFVVCADGGGARAR